MNREIDVTWQFHDDEVKLLCTMEGEHFRGTFYQPPEHPVLVILEGEYANGKPLSKADYEDLYNDTELYSFVERACEPDWDMLYDLYHECGEL